MKNIFTLLFFLSLSLLTAQPAPDFTVTDAHGNQHQLYNDYLDQGKTVVLKLFFVSCPPCNQIAPETETLYQDWGGNNNPDVEFFSMTILGNDNDADVLGYEQLHNLTYPGISADGGALTATDPYRNGTYGPFSGTPTFVIIAPDGTVNFDVFGAGESGTITAIDDAIRASRPVAQPDRTITLSIEDGVKTNDDFLFTVSSDGQSYAPDMGADHLFTVPSGNDYDIEVSPILNERAGVSTFDLILIAKHITGQLPFDSPKKIIAADINNTGTISTFDVIELRKYILFINQNYPNNPHWKFLPADFTFTDPDNPFFDNFEMLSVNDLQNDLTYGIHPVRIGDVNNSQWNNFADSPAETRNDQPRRKLFVEDQHLSAGSFYTVTVYARDFQKILGYQFALTVDPEKAELLEISPTQESGLKDHHYHLQDHQLTFSWHDLEGVDLKADTPLFQLRLQAKQHTALSQVLALNNAFLRGEVYPLSATDLQRLELNFRKTKAITASNKLLKVYPNPMRDQAQVKFQTEATAFVDIEIISLTGRIVQKVVSSYKEAGTHTANLRDLDRGMYFIQLSINGEKISTKRVAVY